MNTVYHADSAGYVAYVATYTSWFSYRDASGLAGWSVTMVRNVDLSFAVVPNVDLDHRAIYDLDLAASYNQFLYVWSCQVVATELEACVIDLAYAMMPWTASSYSYYPAVYQMEEQYETVAVPITVTPEVAAPEVESENSICRRLAFGGTISGLTIDQTSGPGVTIPTSQLCAIKTNLSGLVVNHINSDYFTQYVKSVKASAEIGTHNVSPFVIVNIDLLAHFSKKVWSDLEPLLSNGVVNGVVTSDELAARVRVLSWITFGDDTLSPSPSERFVAYGDHVSCLYKHNIINAAEQQKLGEHIVPKWLLANLQSREPVKNFRFPAKTPVSLRITKTDACVYSLIPKYTPPSPTATQATKVFTTTHTTPLIQPDTIAIPTPTTVTPA